MWRPIKICHSLKFRLIIARGKKYYRFWKTPDALDDFQTMSRPNMTTYESWSDEWSESRLPKIFKMLDTNRLPRHLQSRQQPDKTFFRPQNQIEKSIDYKRRLFGLYGLQSGVDPCELFQDDRILKFEKRLDEAVEKPIDEVVKLEHERRMTERKENEILMNSIKKNLIKMPDMISKFESQQVKQMALSEAAEERKKYLMEQARDRFGYYVNPTDPKFKKLTEEIEEKEKLERKLQKKSAKQSKS